MTDEKKPTNGTLRLTLLLVAASLLGGGGAAAAFPTGHGERIASLEAENRATHVRLVSIEGGLRRVEDKLDDLRARLLERDRR